MNKVMTLRKPVLLLFTLVLVLSFSSCTKDKQESEPYSGNTESSSSTQTSDAVKDQKNQDNNNWVEFFARYFNEGTNGWFDLQLKAENLHKEKCMKEKGFTLELPKTDDDIKLENDGFPFKGRIVADETWGVTDPEYARVYGYVSGFIAHYDYLGTGIAANAPASWPKASPEIQAIVRKRSDGSVPNPDHQKALEECEKSMPSLHGGTDFGTDKNISVSNQVGELRMKIKEMAMRDERLEPELKIWSNCMKEKGFNFEYPPTSKIAGGGNEINGDNHLDIYGGDANELLATADAQCKQKQPEFLNTWHKILDDVEERELKNNLALFEEEKAYTDQLKKNAQDFIDKFSAENG